MGRWLSRSAGHDSWASGSQDGPSLGSVLGDHIYAKAGTYTISVTVFDDDNGSHKVTKQVVIDYAGAQVGVGCAGDGTALVVGSLTVKDRIHVNPIGNTGTLQVTITFARTTYRCINVSLPRPSADSVRS